MRASLSTAAFRRLGLLPLVAALFLSACDAPTVATESEAWDPRLPGGFLYHWPAGATISVYVDPTNEPADADLRAAVLAAFEQWEAVSHYRDFALRLVDNASVANVIVHHRDAPLLVETGGCSYPETGAGGVTFFCPQAIGDGLERLTLLAGPPGQVTMDVRVDRARVASYDQFAALVSHEFGHVLGIGTHSPVTADLMFGGIITATAPTERDARTLRWVLRQRVNLLP